MIVISFFRNGNGRITRVRSLGHSDYVEDGDDIVCAAVSTLVQTAYLAIKDLGVKTEYVFDTDDGLFEFTVESETEKRHDIDVILRAVRVGLDDLRSGYPQYIKTETINQNGGN